MTAPAVSVVVVSRERPDALQRCLTGLTQLLYDPFEVIVVADPEGVAAARKMPLAETIKIIPFDVPNISAARNLGIEASAGEIVAFIDDDAVPEPTWLRFLIGAFDSDTAAAGGFVRGRNGISFQWQARVLDQFGHAHAVKSDNDDPFEPTPPAGGAIKTEGTNMAVRRAVFEELGGFDPAFAFYLDETDLNMRLAQAGQSVRLVPLAQVHHGFAPSRQRRQDRVPRDLFDIGASWAVFQRKHIAEADYAAHFEAVSADERARLLRHLVTGGLEPRDVPRLMKRLTDGYAEGAARTPSAPVVGPAKEAFRQFPSKIRSSVLISRHWRARKTAHAEAQALVDEGKIVTLVLLSRTPKKMRVTFEQAGFWQHSGGVLGQVDRNSPLIQVTSMESRVRAECERVSIVRNLLE